MQNRINLEPLSNIIKFKQAIKALCHVVRRVEEFNNGYYPFEIKRFGIGGSSVRTDTPRDIDICIEADTVPEIWDEWKTFQGILSNNIHLLLSLLGNVQKHKHRASIQDIMPKARSALLKQGVKEKQFDTWFTWLRVSDIRFSVDYGVPIVSFTDEKLVSRFLTAGWKKRRLEIHSVLFNTERKSFIANYDIPHLVIWEKNKGVTIPCKEEIKLFTLKEHKALVNLANQIINQLNSANNLGFQEIPPIYHQTLFLLKDNNICMFKRFEKEAKKLAIQVLEQIEEDLKGNSVNPENNTNLRIALKRFALIGKIEEKICNLKIEDIHAIKDAINSDAILKDIISRRLRNSGFWKRDIVEILDNFDLSSLYEDFQELSQKFSFI